MAAVGTNGTRSIQFGTFEVDLRAGELRRNGSKVKLQEQPFQVLTLLLEQPGEVVTREELQKRLWPVDTFVDFDHSLNAAIRRLRDALGDSAENPRFVETVARRGYRFVAPVNGAQAAVAVQPIPLPPQPPVQGRRLWILGTTLLILLIGAVAGAILANWPHQALQIQQRRLTANPEDHPVLGAAISPDGKYLAFSDNTGFYLRETESGAVHPLWLPKGFNPEPTAWYPDGIRLLVTLVEAPTAPQSLWQISIVGGSPRKLVDDGRQASVSRDGSLIAFIRGPKLDEELWVMQADGERPRRLLGGQRSMFGAPAWSPDGQRIAFTNGDYEPAEFELTTNIAIFTVGDGHRETILPSSSRHALMHTETDSGHLGPGLVWTQDNQLIYSVSEPRPNQQDSNLWSVPLDSRGHIAGTPVRLTATPDDVAAISATADDKRIAYMKFSQNPDVYVTELNADGTRLGPQQRLTLDERRDYPFGWTADSKTVLFASDRDGLFHVFKQRIDQSIPELLVGGNDAAMGPRLAPDNSTVLYVIWPKLGELTLESRLMAVPLSGGPPRQVLLRSGMGNMQCARLPSTLCIYDTRSATEMSFFRFDPVTGKSEELPQLKIEDEPAYAYNWSLSPDGKMLATAKREGVQKDPSITFFSLEDGSKHTITAQAWAGISAIDFAPDGRSLWAPAYTNTGKWALLNIDLQGHTRSVLEDTDMMIGWAIPAPDGKHLALWKARGTSNVWMLERN
jgi:DNA-binding winged helix-turn-helix (wHTH) protein/Tol biopolymer transport system component